MIKLLQHAIVAVLVLGFAPAVLAWGERGHDIVTQVAVQQLSAYDKQVKANLYPIFLSKSQQLGHLANVPDIVWRNKKKVSEAALKANGPTHYVDLDYIAQTPSLKNIPSTLAEVKSQIESLCRKPPNGYRCPFEAETGSFSFDKVGTAPWQIGQLTNLMTIAFKTAGSVKDKKAKVAAVNEAIRLAGLLSHFVGDLANPLHNVRDYDGWEIGQGGVHAFFESTCVNHMPLSMLGSVGKLANQKRGMADIFGQKVPASQESDPVKVALAFSIESFNRVRQLTKIDLKHALLKPSRQEKGLKIPAERREPAVACGHFEAFAQERMALGARVLAHMWALAYRSGGSPDLSDYKSYKYHYTPEFVPVTYLKK